MGSKFKVGDYLRILPDANLGSSGFSHGDIKRVMGVAFLTYSQKYTYIFDEKGVGFYDDEVELAEDYILKQLWQE